MQICNVEVKQLSTTAMQPLQLTSLAKFVGQGRLGGAAPLARHIASESTGGLKLRAVFIDGSTPQHRLQDSGSPRTVSSAAQEGQHDALMALTSMLSSAVAERKLLTPALLSLLGREPYMLREELDSGAGLIPSSPEIASPTISATEQHMQPESVPMRGPSLVLKAHTLQQQEGVSYNGWPPQLQQLQLAGRGEVAGVQAEPSSSSSSRWQELQELALEELKQRNRKKAERDAARAGAPRRRGAPFPPAGRPPWTWGNIARIAARKQRGAAVAALDEAVETYGSGGFAAAAARPPAAEARSASTAAARACEGGRPVPPKKGDIVELACQSLAFGGKVRQLPGTFPTDL